jgi:dTDP-4-amino-4,6-dideoxygalactose transaminase
VVTDSEAIAAKLRVLRHVGQDGKYNHVVKGYNSRLDNLQAAVLRVKMPHVEAWNAGRRRMAAIYDRGLAGAGIGMPPTGDDRTGSQHLYVVEVEGRDAVQLALAECGIGTSIHYPIPIHLQPAFADLGLPAGAFPRSEASVAQVLSLPMFAEMSDNDAEYVVASLLAVTGGGSG